MAIAPSRVIVIGAVTASAAACVGLSALAGGEDAPQKDDDASGMAAPETGGPAADDAGTDAAPTVYHDLRDPTRWETFTLGFTGYFGGAFDGRYVYLSPSGTNLFVRYDTTLPFGVANSWATVDPASVNLTSSGYRGAVFNDRYVYFVSGAKAARFDTRGPFNDASSWTQFDVSTVSVDAGLTPSGFTGGAYDGRYLYLGPANGGFFVRHDTQMPFESPSSWKGYNVGAAHFRAGNAYGAVFDGQYVYFVNGDCCAQLTRFDTHLAFDVSTSWTTFDTHTVSPSVEGFAGAVFDGRYVTLVPDGQGSWNGIAKRYDTTSSFALQGSFSAFDIGANDAGSRGFVGGGFDGRYVYFAPWSNGVPSGFVARFDSQGPFTDASVWSTFDMTTVNPDAKGYAGAVYDGRYLYFVPLVNGTKGVVARFDTKEPASMPPGYRGSFL